MVAPARLVAAADPSAYPIDWNAAWLMLTPAQFFSLTQRRPPEKPRLRRRACAHFYGIAAGLRRYTKAVSRMPQAASDYLDGRARPDDDYIRELLDAGLLEVVRESPRTWHLTPYGCAVLLGHYRGEVPVECIR